MVESTAAAKAPPSASRAACATASDLQRERLRQRRGDAVEAALDARLAGALLECRSVAQGDGGEPGEGLEHVGVRACEDALPVLGGHSYDALLLAGEQHRCDQRRGDPVVCAVRCRQRELGVIAQTRSARGAVLPGQAQVRRKLPVDELRIEFERGGAPERVALGVEQVAVCGIRAQQARERRDEALQHRVESELAGDDPRRLEQRRGLRQALLRLLEEARHVDREPRLPRDALGELDLALRPRAGLTAMEAEHAHQAVHDDDRRGERRQRARGE